MNKKLAISAKDEKVPFPAAVRGSKTPVLKLSIVIQRGTDVSFVYGTFRLYQLQLCLLKYNCRPFVVKIMDMQV